MGARWEAAATGESQPHAQLGEALQEVKMSKASRLSDLMERFLWEP